MEKRVAYTRFFSQEH